MTAKELIEIILSKSEAPELHTQYHSEFGISIKDASISEDIRVEVQLLEDLTFENVVFDGTLHFDEVENSDEEDSDKKGSDEGKIIFINCRFLKGVNFKNRANENSIRFENSEVKSGLNIENSLIGGLTFYNGFSDYIKVSDSVIGEATFDEYEVQEKLEIVGKTDFERLELVNSRLKDFRFFGGFVRGQLRLEKSNVAEFSIQPKNQSMVFINKLQFENLFLEDYFISEIEVNEIVIKKSRIIGGKVVHLERLKVNFLRFDHLLNYGFLHLQHIEGKKELHNLGEERSLSTIQKPSSKLHLFNSFLGNVSFTHCNFENFDDIIISDSDLSQISFVGTQNLNPKKIKTDADKKKLKLKETAVEKRLLFGQLKKAFQSRGDKVAIVHYHALEMVEYQKSLPAFPSHFSEHVLLFMNWLSNSFDRIWIQGILVTLLSGFVFLILYCIALKDWTVDGWSLFWENKHNVFEFMLPTHSWSFLTTDSMPPNGWSCTIDAFGRILNSYFIYQTIQAFRKYGKA